MYSPTAGCRAERAREETERYWLSPLNPREVSTCVRDCGTLPDTSRSAHENANVRKKFDRRSVLRSKLSTHFRRRELINVKNGESRSRHFPRDDVLATSEENNTIHSCTILSRSSRAVFYLSLYFSFFFSPLSLVFKVDSTLPVLPCIAILIHHPQASCAERSRVLISQVDLDASTI